MRPSFIATLIVVGAAGPVSAQNLAQPGTGFQPVPYQQPNVPLYPFGNYPSVMPNIFNPVNQPLSPYLNLLRGGNPAANYFYGVRPGTIGGAGQFGPGPSLAMGGNRPPFFQQQQMLQDPLELPGAEPGYVLPPAGHPVVFNNTLGYFPGGPGMRGGQRPGLSGPPAFNRPPAKK